jgi:hypothetical protein
MPGSRWIDRSVAAVAEWLRPPEGWVTRSPGLAMLLYWTPIVAFLVVTIVAVELEGLSLIWQLVVWSAALVLVAVADAARARNPARQRERPG